MLNSINIFTQKTIGNLLLLNITIFVVFLPHVQENLLVSISSVFFLLTQNLIYIFLVLYLGE